MPLARDIAKERTRYMALNKRQVKFLKKRAHTIDPIFQIGKNGMTDTILSELTDAIEKRELIKVQLLQNTLETNADVKTYIEEHSPIKVVQSIGNVLVLYKSSSNENNRFISDQVRNIQ